MFGRGPLGVRLAPGAPRAEGVAYLKTGSSIINEPTPDTATRAVLDNWPYDPFRKSAPTAEYYGALIGALTYDHFVPSHQRAFGRAR